MSSGVNIGWQAVAEAEAIGLLKECYHTGIRFYDTSEGYGAGMSETLIGKAFADKNDVQVCSKFGWEYRKGVMERAFLPERIPAAIDESLNRLNRQYLDYYLLHSPRPDEITSELIDAMMHLKDSGKVKKIGLSVSFLQPYLDFKEHFDVFEVVYNEITQQNLAYLDAFAGKEVWARSIFASGLLLKNAEQLDKGNFTDWRNSLDEKLFDAAKKYRQSHPNDDAKALIIKALDKPFAKVLVGISNVAQLATLAAK